MTLAAELRADGALMPMSVMLAREFVRQATIQQFRNVTNLSTVRLDNNDFRDMFDFIGGIYGNRGLQFSMQVISNLTAKNAHCLNAGISVGIGTSHHLGNGQSFRANVFNDSQQWQQIQASRRRNRPQPPRNSRRSSGWGVFTLYDTGGYRDTVSITGQKIPFDH